MIEIIIEYISIWLPSLVAILGMVATICVSLGKTRVALKELKSEDTLKKLELELKQERKDNKELRTQLDLIIDKLYQIEEYRKSR